MTPDGGARAAVFLTLAAAAMLSDEIESGVDPRIVDPIRAIVERELSPPAADVAAIEEVRARVVEERNEPATIEAADRGGTMPSAILAVGQAALSYQALALAGAQPDKVVAFEYVAGVDQTQWKEIMNFEWVMATTITFRTYWDGAKDHFLESALARLGQAA